MITVTEELLVNQISYILKSDDNFIKNIEYTTASVKLRNFDYLLIYDYNMEIVEDAVEFLNFHYDCKSLNTRIKDMHALKMLYSFSDIIGKNIKDFSLNDISLLKTFLRGYSYKNEIISFYNLTERSLDTLNNYLGTYRNFMSFLNVENSNFLKERNVRLHNCLEEYNFIKANKSYITNERSAHQVVETPDYISVEEFAIMLKVVRKNYTLQDEIIIRLMYENGLRLGEVLGLTNEDIFTRYDEEEDETFCYLYIRNKSNINSKNKNMLNIIEFLNFIDDIKTGKQKTIFSKPNAEIDISPDEVNAYNNYIFSKYKNNRTISGKIYIPRGFLKYVKKAEIYDINNACFYYLENTLKRNYNDSNPLSDNELTLLSEHMRKKADESRLNKMFLFIFYLALEIEFRPSQILALQVDCVKEINAKDNEFVIVSKTKTSNGDFVKQPITSYTKRHIDALISLTQEIRSECPYDDLKPYLFLNKNEFNNRYNIIRQGTFNIYMKNCCAECGINEYTISNLRDTHATRGAEFIKDKGLSEIELNVLTGHKNAKTDERHYIKINRKKCLSKLMVLL